MDRAAARRQWRDGERFTLLDRSVAGDFAESVRRGLTSTPKSLEPRFFYDDLGSALFDAICHLDEYYVTRAEHEILVSHGEEIVAALGAVNRVVEIGSGVARKTRLLLDPLTSAGTQIEYLPIDVDAGMLQASAFALLNEYPSLRIHAVACDFRGMTPALRTIGPARGRTAVFFLGSTIGNLDPEASVAMLQDLRSLLRPGDLLLLGADLLKPREVLENAYNDALGVTAAFNLNLLARINRELDGRFDLASFRHRAFFDEEKSRIEMHLVSVVDQRVAIEKLGIAVELAEGESIHTENSHKYDHAMLERLAHASRFSTVRSWTDSRRWFADLLLQAQ